MASKISTTDDVNPEFDPGSVEGVSVPPIPKRLGVSDTRKFARRIGNPFGSNDTANDRDMLSVAGSVKITRSGYYSVNFALDLNVSWGTIYNSALNVNGSVVRQSFLSSAYGFTRNSCPATYSSYLNSWDLLTLTAPDGWTVQNTSWTFIEVLEIS